MLGFGGEKKLKKSDIEGKTPDPFSIKEDWVTIPGLGIVLLREMNSGQRDEWEWFLANRKVTHLTEEQKAFHNLDDTIDKIPDPRDLKQFLISMCLIEPSSKTPMYSGPEGVKKLHPNLVNLLYDACTAICGLRRVDHEAAKKNSGLMSTSVDASGLPAGAEKQLSS